MSDDELVEKALEHLRKMESRRTNAPDKLRAIKVDALPKQRVRQAIVIDFQGEATSARIQVVMDRDSGQMITAKYVPAK